MRELVVRERGQRLVIAGVEADLESRLRELPDPRPRQAVLRRLLADELRKRLRRGGADRRQPLDLRGKAGERLVGRGPQARLAKRRARVEAAVLDALAADGYDPTCTDDGITLANCPFHALAREETELVCGMNLAYLGGLLGGIGAAGLEATLDPADGRCCVRLKPRS